MIYRSIVRVFDKDTLVDEKEFKRPVTKEMMYHLKIFTELNVILHPNCIFECINFKDGTGETFILSPPTNNSLW